MRVNHLLLLAAISLPAVFAPAEEGPGILKIGESQLKSPLHIRKAPGGGLLVLDKHEKELWLVSYEPDGRAAGEVRVPEGVRAAEAVVDADGRYYFADGRGGDLLAWKSEGPEAKDAKDAKPPEKFEPGVSTLDLRERDGACVLYAYKPKENAVLTVNLKTQARASVALKAAPEKGALVSLHARTDGHLYLYSENERVVFHFDAEGALVDKFGSGEDLRNSVPAGCMGRSFDVADSGEVYWSQADYGVLMKYSADGTTGTRYNGREAWNKTWTGPVHTLTGFALSGERAYIIGNAYNRITAVPFSVLKPGGRDVETIDTRVFGLNPTVTAAAPYKMFTTPEVKLKLDIAAGNRRVHQAAVTYKLRGYSGEVLAEGVLELPLPGREAATVEFPAFNLPKLGWYQFEAALKQGDETLVERVHFISRVTEDPRTPIPEKEAGGWNDLLTHRAVGMGLHRFGGDLERLKKMKPEIEQAKQLKVPYFILLESEKQANPETVKGIFELDPDCPVLEIVNEPNLRMKPEQYVEVLKTCRETAKAINPKTLILGPSQCGTALDWFEAFFKAGGGEQVDGVSVHTYMRHNSMDAVYWLWKLKRLREAMAANGCGEKPLYMTEHGFMGDYHEIIIRPQWQARNIFLEYMATDRFGMWPNRYFYYYVNFGGYAGFSSFIVNQRRELFPAATLLRTRAQMLEDRTYARALEFGSPGDWLVLGNIYEGKEKDLLILQNTGALRPITVALNVPKGAEAFDAFGNKLELTRAGELSRLEIGREPSYVCFIHGHALKGALPEFPAELKNVAPEAKVVVADEDAALKAAFLTNGALEYDFHDEPEREGFRAKAEHLPLDVDLTFEKPRTLHSAILYGSFADNDKCTPLAYEVLVKTGGEWKKVDAVDVPADGRAVKLEPYVKRVSGYDDPWIFVHHFEPVAAEAVRFHFVRTTFGQWPNEAVKISNLQPRVHLREIQIFGPAGEEKKTEKAEGK